MRRTIAAAAVAAVAVALGVPPWWVAPPGRAPVVLTLCRDGWRSRALHYSGACSHHGGVVAFGEEAPKPVAGERTDAAVHAAVEAERRACAGVMVDGPGTTCAAR